MQRQFASDFKLEVSAIEIYCDQLRDLFSDDEKTKGLGIDLKIDPATKKVII